ncbi:MAG: peptidoglycan DD-metalloendopeptidase family protein [Spirochaetes bacterium]|nr:peptidoglycan DD-metalloendopeptidase family protein [Spirochaetota bacterium]
MSLQLFNKALKPLVQKPADFFSNIYRSKDDNLKSYTFLFILTIFIFLIITTQHAESRHNLGYAHSSTNLDPTLPEYNIFKRFEKEVVINQGETISSILHNIGVSYDDSRLIIDSLSPLFNLRRLQPGRKIKFIISQEGTQSDPRVELLRIERSPGMEVRVSYRNGAYVANLVEVKTIPLYFARQGAIENSLYIDAARLGIPSPAIMEMFRLFSFDVDFQRDLHRGNEFKILFRNRINLDGETVSRGEIIFAALETAHRTHKLYRFTGDDGITDFFDEKGQGVRKTLLRTPIHGARISSGFGRRTHPIRGYSHMHRGLDFAAPRNTPIIAAGSGVVKLAGWHGSFGNTVIIRHPNEFKTLYAHMNSFASGIRPGRHVRQGEVIGFVGTTGVSTGYHLHYEVIFRGQQINPATIRAPSERRLTQKELERFFVEIKEIDAKFENKLMAL